MKQGSAELFLNSAAFAVSPQLEGVCRVLPGAGSDSRLPVEIMKQSPIILAAVLFTTGVCFWAKVELKAEIPA